MKLFRSGQRMILNNHLGRSIFVWSESKTYAPICNWTESKSISIFQLKNMNKRFAQWPHALLRQWAVFLGNYPQNFSVWFWVKGGDISIRVLKLSLFLFGYFKPNHTKHSDVANMTWKIFSLHFWSHPDTYVLDLLANHLRNTDTTYVIYVLIDQKKITVS